MATAFPPSFVWYASFHYAAETALLCAPARFLLSLAACALIGITLRHARGRVAFAATPDTNSRAAPVLVCIRRSAPSSPAHGLRAYRYHAAAAARRAASLRVGLETAAVGGLVSRPPSGPSALLRTPPRLSVSRCGLGARSGRQLLRLRADPFPAAPVPGPLPIRSEVCLPCAPALRAYSFSAVRSLALRARGFSSSSRSVGRMGFLFTSLMSGVRPHTHTGKSGGQMQPRAKSASPLLTMRSSSEWKVMTASRPPCSAGAPPAGASAPRCPARR